MTKRPAAFTCTIYTIYNMLQTSGDSSSPLVFLSSFDASCLEFRMLMPLLEAAGVEAYAVDLVGWGFTEARLDPELHEILGPAERRAHLFAFCQEKVSFKRTCSTTFIHLHIQCNPSSFVRDCAKAAFTLLKLMHHVEQVPCEIVIAARFSNVFSCRIVEAQLAKILHEKIQ